jgi:TolB protein
MFFSKTQSLGRFTTLSILLSCIFLQNTALAILHLELIQSHRQAVSIGLNAFEDNANNHDLTNLLSQIIKQDLHNSGKFHVKQAEDSHAGYAYWRKHRAKYYVASKLSNRLGFHHWSVSLYKTGLKAAKLEKTVSFTEKNPRQAAHSIADAIYQTLTGQKSIFQSKIAYISVNREQKEPYRLIISDSDGQAAQTLLRSAQPLMSPAFSPDGKQLAYVSFESGHAAIYLQHIASAKREVISEAPGINGAPAFSPDGKQLALVLSKSGSPNIYTLDLETKAIQALTKGWAINTEPQWTQDGKAIVFTSNRGGSPQVYRLLLDDKTTSAQRLTFTGRYNTRPRISHDGSTLVVLHHNQDDYGIAAYNLKQGRFHLLTHIGDQESPSLSSNDQMILYASRYAGRGVLAMVSIDGNIHLRLPAQQGDVQEPVWSP